MRIASTYQPSPDDDPEIYEALAAANGLPFLREIPEAAACYSHLLSRNQAVSLKCVPIGLSEDKMTFAVSNPLDFEISDLLSHTMRRSMDSLTFVVTPPGEIQRAFGKFYP